MRPGYGFSHTPNQRRLSIEEIADLFARLMTNVLGYSRFAAQGGDWGSFITARLWQVQPEKLVGIHLNMVPVPPHPADRAELSEAGAGFLKEADAFQKAEAGYQWIQGTKPQTLAYGLSDSPVGLAAWIIEKFHTWTDCSGSIESRVTKDDLLTNIMIYWVTNPINSSFYLYYRLRHHPWRLDRGEKNHCTHGNRIFSRRNLSAAAGMGGTGFQPKALDPHAFGLHTRRCSCYTLNFR